MAKRSQDLAAAKAKKQKIILIVGGVLLLAVAGLQGPKLLKGSGSSTAPKSHSSASATGTSLTPVAVGAVVTSKGSATVAGVALPGATVVKVAPSQLASFTLFEVKDPFVQKVDDTAPTDGQAAPPDSSGSGAPATTTSESSSGSTSSAPTATTPPPPPVVYATINVDGKAQQVQAKGQFPTAAPLFVLRTLKKNVAKIGVAGGSFDDGQAVTLKLGKRVTLVNTATGVRYELKLVYTGAQPEVIEGFTTTQGTAAPATAAQGAATTGGATTTTAK